MDHINPAIMGMAIAAAYLVKGDVDVLRGMIGSRSSRTRWLLPCFGTGVSVAVVGLGYAFDTFVDQWYGQAAGVALASNLAYLLAAGQTAQHKAAREA